MIYVHDCVSVYKDMEHDFYLLLIIFYCILVFRLSIVCEK